LTEKETQNKKGEVKIKLNKNAIKKIIGVFAGKLNKMLNDDINESVEIGSKKVGKTRVDYGIKMKFLDDVKSFDNPSNSVQNNLRKSKQNKKLIEKKDDTNSKKKRNKN
jgi:hypothetical protein